jgi:hypothetical protein
MTLERYFKINGKKNIIDFSLRAQVADGIVTFYIHPDSKDGDTRDYYVFGNELIPTEEFDKRKAECGEKLIQRFLEIKERKNNTMNNVESPSRQVETLVRRQNSFAIDKTEFRNAIEKFVNANRKINWEAEFERGQYCIGEDKLYDFIERILSA